MKNLGILDSHLTNYKIICYEKLSLETAVLLIYTRKMTMKFLTSAGKSFSITSLIVIM
jgi:hypothetical protein